MEFGIFSSLLMVLLGLFGIGSNAIDNPILITEETTAVVERVIDGDTILVRMPDGVRETVRYIGIDTPEPRRDGEPACGAYEATEVNKKLVLGQTVRLVPDSDNRDRFDRLLRYVYIDDVMVNEVLVRDGYAMALPIEPNTTFADVFETHETEAVMNQRGMWATCRPA